MSATPDHLSVRLPSPVRGVRIVGQAAEGAPAGAPSPQGPGAPPQDQQSLRQEMQALQSARAALGAAAAQCREAQQKIVEQAEQQLLDLSLDIAQKVLAQEIQAQRYEMEPIVREALSRIPEGTDVVVHLHPDDLARCALAQGEQEDVPSSSVRFVPDAGVERAGCRVETPDGAVESTAGERLTEVTRALKGAE